MHADRKQSVWLGDATLKLLHLQLHGNCEVENNNLAAIGKYKAQCGVPNKHHIIARKKVAQKILP